SPYTYSWHFGSLTSPPIDSVQNLNNYLGSPGTYYITLNDGCSLEAIDSIIITPGPFPSVTINVIDSSVCFPDSVFFSATSDIGVSYDWDFNSDGVIDLTTTDSTASFVFLAPGVYDITLTVTSPIGCQTTVIDTAGAVINAPPTADFDLIPASATILNPEANTIDQSSSAAQWSWDFDQDNLTDAITQNASYVYGDVGNYIISLAIVDSNGCVDSISKPFVVIEEYALYVPNSFTPNGDGDNDFFFADGVLEQLDLFNLVIYDRWGMLIWESYDQNSQWDGKFEGIISPLDVYVWKLTIAFPDQIPRTIYGHVTLLN
ncbi:MAG: gliding motility-associated C-terminal domain-containing protein, partial [Flavobacteriales bacterium]|nr:gliding motility-associated C-terminal domain-containing protein [Flavobacteriales bacterium]